jgi:hypothetical protein
MKIGASVQVILRAFLIKLRGCNIGITDIDLMCEIRSRGGDRRTYTYVASFIKVDLGIQKLIAGIHTQTGR